MGIFEKEKHIDPRYDFLEKYVRIMYKGMWIPTKYEKLIAEVDARQYHNSMSEVDKEVVKRCILAVAMVEDKVKTYWSTLSIHIPQTIIGDIGGLFGQSEVTHRRSYHSLANELKIDSEEVHQYPVIRDRVAYLTKHLENDPKIIGKKRVLKNLILFTSLVEKGSLFTQFYILMKYAKESKGLKTISALQQSTATEENVHYSFGIDLINIIKREYPQLWSEYLVELVEKNLQAAYQAELKLIDWFFEKGVPEHLTKKEVINFLNYNFNTIAKDLELDANFDYDKKVFEEENQWFVIKTSIPVEPDFFDNAVGGYSSEGEEINVEDIFGE